MGSIFSKPVNQQSTTGAILPRPIGSLPLVKTGSNNTYQPHDSWALYDGSGGATVSNLGHGYRRRIWDAASKAHFEVDYAPPAHFTTSPVEQYKNALLATTKGHMTKCLLLNSGSDGVEAAMKLSCQYFHELGEERNLYISRRLSYHGATMGALSLSGHTARREPFELILSKQVRQVSACNVYRDQGDMSDTAYIKMKEDEMEAMFQEAGPKKVIAVVLEPVVGAALGCAAPPKGYLTAMKNVAHRHGALFITDENMCGFGRTGTMHTWEQEETAVPDIQVMGKGLAAGVQTLSAMLYSQRVHDGITKNGGSFRHGHTFQDHPTAAAAAHETLRIIQKFNLLENVRRQGSLLKKLLQEKVGVHANVGDVRGPALFIGLEFVKDKRTKTPFNASLRVWEGFFKTGLEEKHKLYLYPGGGTMDGVSGDHIIISPPYDITEQNIYALVDMIESLVNDYFKELNSKLEKTGHSEL